MMYTRSDRSKRLAVRCLPACAVLLLYFLANCHLARASCENEVIRSKQGALTLPDCRAYELVTPAASDSDEPFAVPLSFGEAPLSSPAGMQASTSGDRMAWTSQYTSPSSMGLDYLSTRGPDGWTTEDVIPPQSVENGLDCPGLEQMAAYSSELTSGVLADGFGQAGSGRGEESRCGHDEPLLVSGEPVGFQNLFLRDNESVSYQLVDVMPPGAPAPTFPASFQAGSNDLSHVVFEEGLPLVPGAGSGDELYDYFDGAVHLVSYLPGGTPVHGVLAGSTVNYGLEPYNLANSRHAMSADGSRVFFEAEGDLYARTNPEQPAAEECASPTNACSVQLDEAQVGAEGPSGGGGFMAASEDGSRVFFTDANRLTSGSHAEPGKPDLYEYDFQRPAGSRLIDLTAGAGGPGEVLGVSGASASGEEVYFVAEAALTGSQENSSRAVAQAGQPNLYLASEGALTFVATLNPSADDCDWNTACLNTGGSPTNGPAGLTARISGNGAYIAFQSDLELTGYNNEGPTCVPVQHGGPGVEGYTPGHCEEIYLYSQSDNKLECVSCNPDRRVAPLGPADIHYPSEASPDTEMRNTYPQRYVSESGQVFFESRDPLVLAAANGQYNVYEYEGGEPHLISAATSEAGSYFLDANPTGSNVFFATAKALVKSGSNAIYAIYDAREDGGFAEESRQTTACEDGEECKGAVTSPPAFPAPATVSVEAPVPPSPAKRAVKKAKTKKRKHRKRDGSTVKNARRHRSDAEHGRTAKKTSRGGK